MQRNVVPVDQRRRLAVRLPSRLLDDGARELLKRRELQVFYAHSEADAPGRFIVLCGNNIGNIYSCLKSVNACGTFDPALISCASS